MQQQKQSTQVTFTAPPGGDFSLYFKAAPKIRPLLNVGCLFDIFTGRYHYGKYGEAILNGGFGHVTGVGGQGNTFKSVLLHYFILQALNRYQRTMAQVYDTEGSVSGARLAGLSVHLENIADVDLQDTGRMMITDSPTMKADVWYRAFRDYTDNKVAKENRKAWTVTSPFWDDKSASFIQTLVPTLCEIDSLSMATTTGVQNIYDEKDIGSSDMNTEALRSSRDKSQMLMDMADSTIATNTFVAMSAHVGPQHQLDPRSPPAKQLLFLKQKVAFKHVPQKFTFTTNVLWYVTGAEVMKNDSTKSVEFPRSRDDDLKGDTDLQKLTIMALRNKYGASGIPFEVILSQDEGVLEGLTFFNYIRSFDRFGLGGNVQNYFVELAPDISLSRTTIRGKIDESYRLRRALEVTAQLCQMMNHWDDPEHLFKTPKQIYEALTAQGYDVGALLENTRAYWIYEEDKESNPYFYLSTLDILNMCKSENPYIPYWLEECPQVKAQLVKHAAKSAPAEKGKGKAVEPVTLDNDLVQALKSVA